MAGQTTDGASISAKIIIMASASTLVAPLLATADYTRSYMPAKKSRLLAIRLRGPAGDLLSVFADAARTAGVECRPSRVATYAGMNTVAFPESDPGGDRGSLWAVDVADKKAIGIQAYSSIRITPHGESTLLSIRLSRISGRRFPKTRTSSGSINAQRQTTADAVSTDHRSHESACARTDALAHSIR